MPQGKRQLKRTGRILHLGAFVAFTVIALFWQYCRLAHVSDSRDQAYVWGWDSNFYFAWGRSLALDGDVDFENDLNFVAQLRGFGSTQADFENFIENVPLTGTGRMPNKYGMGTGLLSLPWLLVARASCALKDQIAGGNVSRFASIYPVVFAAGNSFWGCVGLIAAWSFLRRRFGARIAYWSVLAILFGSPLLYYIYYEPEMAHTAGFACVTLLIVCASPGSGGVAGIGPGRKFLTGMIFGLCVMIRYNLASAISIPFTLWLLEKQGSRAAKARALAVSIMVFCAGALLAFSPQLFAWKIIYGEWMLDTYTGETMHAFPVHILKILFGTRAGLFLWTPLALLSFAGLLAGCLRRYALAIAGVGTLTLTAWIYGSWEMYWLGNAFGMRGFVDFSFFWMLGLAMLLGRARRLRSGILRQAPTITAVLCVLWNLHWIIAYRAEIQGRDASMDLKASLQHWEEYGDAIENDRDRWRGAHYTLFTPADLQD